MATTSRTDTRHEDRESGGIIRDIVPDSVDVTTANRARAVLGLVDVLDATLGDVRVEDAEARGFWVDKNGDIQLAASFRCEIDALDGPWFHLIDDGGLVVCQPQNSDADRIDDGHLRLHLETGH